MEPIDLRDRDVVERLVKERHWDGRQSVRAIEREMGIGKTLLSSWCKRHGITVRSKVAQISISHHLIDRRHGPSHHNWGKTKADLPWLGRRALEMTSANPARDPEIRARMSAHVAETYRKTPTHTEALALGLIASGGVPFVFQHAVGSFILDFAFVGFSVAVEIDGKIHKSPIRNESDLKRDKSLIQKGWAIIRVPGSQIGVSSHWLSVVKKYVPDFQIPSGLPLGATRGARKYKYRVIVRDTETPTGRKI